MINYTFPLTIEEPVGHGWRLAKRGGERKRLPPTQDYVHRIGRTGRAGKKGAEVAARSVGPSQACSRVSRGLAICFFCPESKGAQDEKAPAAPRGFGGFGARARHGLAERSAPAQAHAGDLCKVLRDASQEVPKARVPRPSPLCPSRLSVL